jgi:hypothetical protein
VIGRGWIGKCREAKMSIRSQHITRMNGECGRRGGYQDEGKLMIYEFNCIFLLLSHTKSPALFVGTILRQLEIVRGSKPTSFYEYISHM